MSGSAGFELASAIPTKAQRTAAAYAMEPQLARANAQAMSVAITIIIAAHLSGVMPKNLNSNSASTSVKFAKTATVDHPA